MKTTHSINSNKSTTSKLTDNNDISCLVGIGASAGGLESLEHFFRAMPPDSGLSFVVIQHLSPDFKSLMAQLLERYTIMPAIPVLDKQEILPNTIYLLPPRKELIVTGPVLISEDKPKDGSLFMPINVFFRSMAASWGERSAAIVLSGTGSDGSEGIIDVRDAGGLVLVETPETSNFDGMPQSAKNTGCADAILSPEEMPKLLVAFANDPAFRYQFNNETDYELHPPGLPTILEQLKKTYQINFNDYKSLTIARRIERRLAMQTPKKTLEEYSQHLTTDPSELDKLYKDLLIGVTRFFRDTEAFEILRLQIIPNLVATISPEEEIRVWVCACSTGEEAYSIAILFMEAIKKIGRSHKLKILATDLHADSLKTATDGIYPETSFQDMPKELQDDYFEKIGGAAYKVVPLLRKNLVFSVHNVLKDPPFTRIHFVSCRNLLIYFQSAAQNRTLAALRYALQINGILFLGSSETLGETADGLESLDRRLKIYRKTHRVVSSIRFSGNFHENRDSLNAPATTGPLLRVYDSLLERFIPAGILITENYEIVYVFGDAGIYVEGIKGRFSSNILKLLPHGLFVALASALRNAKKHAKEVHFKRVRYVSRDGKEETVSLSITPIQDKLTNVYHYLIRFFQDTLPDTQLLPLSTDSPLAIDLETSDHVRELEQELQRTRESLQTTVEELETTNEELQASNEELLASNEELQSTNEELHSVNEELYTVNVEHEQKIEQLNVTSADLRNLMQSTDTATIFLDLKGRIKLYTPGALTIFDFLPQDIGRELTIFHPKVPDPQLYGDIKTVLQSQARIERSVVSDDQTFIRRCSPYENMRGKIEGIVVNYINTTSITSATSEINRQRARLEAIIQANEIATWEWFIPTGEFILNARWAEMLGYTLDELTPASLETWKKLTHPDDFPNTMEALTQHFSQKTSYYEHEIRMRHKEGRWIWILDRGKVVSRGTDNQPLFMIGTHLEISEKKLAQLVLLESEKRFRTLFDKSPDPYLIIDIQTSQIVDCNQNAERLLGGKRDELIGKIIWELAPIYQPNGQLSNRIATEKVAEIICEGSGNFEWFHARLDGTEFWSDVTASIITIGERQFILCAWRDISSRKKQEMEIKNYQNIIQSSNDAIISETPQGIITSWNKGAERIFGYSAADMLERFSLPLIPADRFEEESAILANVSQHQVIQYLETTRLRQDGNTIEIGMAVSPIYNDQGQLVGISKIIHDISEVKQRETLEQARIKAEAANAAKSRFLATMSHEIRTPLNAIIGMAHLLARTNLSSDQQKQLATIDAASRTLRDQINDILSLAKIESGRMPLEKKSFQLKTVCSDLEKVFLPLASAKGITMVLDEPCITLPVVLEGDVAKLRQILVNFVGNAIKFTERGWVKITVAAVTQDEKQITLRFTIIDTGIGIDPAILPQLFQPFTQADSSTTRTHGGTGLGLSIVKQLAELMGGQVGVISTPGVGSEFWCEIPLAISTSSLNSTIEPLHRLTVVIAVDTFEEREQLVNTAHQLPWEIVTVTDDDALTDYLIKDQLREQPTDCILLTQPMITEKVLVLLKSLEKHTTGPAIILIADHGKDSYRQNSYHKIVSLSAIFDRTISSSLLFNIVNDSINVRSRVNNDHLSQIPLDKSHSYWLAGAQLLIVDDSRLNLDVCQRLLEYEGANTVLCESGTQALLELFADPDRFDAVLMDIQMPVMDGCETTRRFFAQSNVAIPIIALTAGALAEEQTTALAAGMVDFLTKPVDSALMVLTLRRHIATYRGVQLPLFPRLQTFNNSNQKNWPIIPGIDSEQASQILGNDQIFFQRLLKQLLNDYPAILEQIYITFKKNELTATAQLLHKLRGKISNLGAIDIADLLKKLELSATKETLNINKLNSLSEKLKALSQAATPWISSFSELATPSSSATPIPELTTPRFSELCNCLRQRRLLARQLFQEFKPALATLLSPKKLQLIEQHITNLNFREALTYLEPLQDITNSYNNSNQ